MRREDLDQLLAEQGAREASDEGTLSAVLALGEVIERDRAELAFRVDEAGARLNDSPDLVGRDVQAEILSRRRKDHVVDHGRQCLSVDVAIGADLVIRLPKLRSQLVLRQLLLSAEVA